MYACASVYLLEWVSLQLAFVAFDFSFLFRLFLLFSVLLRVFWFHELFMKAEQTRFFPSQTQRAKNANAQQQHAKAVTTSAASRPKRRVAWRKVCVGEVEKGSKGWLPSQCMVAVRCQTLREWMNICGLECTSIYIYIFYVLFFFLKVCVRA